MQPAEEKKQPVPAEAAAPKEGPAPTGEPAADPAPPEPAEPVEAAPTAPPVATSALRETLETVVVALLVALVIRSFLVQLYVVDGESMYPTLHHGDRLLVNKMVYRLREPKPGEIIVVEDPANPRRQLIKRVVAVEGETVEVRNRVVFVDGRPLKETFTNPTSVHFKDVAPSKVPEGHVYVMGDNRGGSLDSRMLGPIQRSKIEGKAFYLFWPPARIGKHGPLEAARLYLDE
ncbi:MAG: signal peptidase I [Bacillota bacterium]